MEENKTTAAPETPEAAPAADVKDEKAEKKKAKKTEKELSELQKKLEAKEEELRACEDKYLRMMAEYDNFRKRTVKEKEASYGNGRADTGMPHIFL